MAKNNCGLKKWLVALAAIAVLGLSCCAVTTGSGVEIPGVWNGMWIESLCGSVPDGPAPQQLEPDIALGFEEYEVGTSLTAENCTAMCSAVNETMSLRVETPTGSFEGVDAFSPPFSSAGEKCLHVKTRFGNPCAFAIKEDKSSVEIPAGDSHVIDFLAMFTCFDQSLSDLTAYSLQSAGERQSMLLRGGVSDEAHTILVRPFPGFVCNVDNKIMLWQQEVHDEHDLDIVIGTNWYVRAGNGRGEAVDRVITSSDGGPLPGCADWHRITFRACRAEASDALFFNVFIDGRQARSGEMADFPSMTASGENCVSVSTVSFDGHGMVDNVVACDGSTFDGLTGNHGQDDEPWTPGGVTDQIPEVAADATPESVTNAIEAAGFADVAAVKDAIAGSAAEYAAFKEWADSVKGAGNASGAAAGETAVVANTNAAAAYLLGAERLFENAPKIEFGEVRVADGEDGGLGTSRHAMTLSVTVKDGEEAVRCAAEKVKSLFKATRDLGDWNGAARLEPEVSIEATDDPTTMRFKVTLGDGTSQRAFLQIRR